jgi:hypothetical protein
MASHIRILYEPSMGLTHGVSGYEHAETANLPPLWPHVVATPAQAFDPLLQVPKRLLGSPTA